MFSWARELCNKNSSLRTRQDSNGLHQAHKGLQHISLVAFRAVILRLVRLDPYHTSDAKRHLLPVIRPYLTNCQPREHSLIISCLSSERAGSGKEDRKEMALRLGFSYYVANYLGFKKVTECCHIFSKNNYFSSVLLRYP